MRELTSKTIKIGRGAAETSVDDSYILLSDELVSRHHVTLKWQFFKQCYLLLHKSKTNSTFVNGRPAKRILLAPGDEIRVGHTTLLVSKKEEEVKAPGQVPLSASSSTEVLLELHKLASKRSKEKSIKADQSQDVPTEDKSRKSKSPDFKWAPPEERS